MFMNEWYKKHTFGTALKHPDWNAFRDPDEVVYRTYNLMQDGQETYVFGLFDQFSEREHDKALDRPLGRHPGPPVHAGALPLPHAADGLGLRGPGVAGQHPDQLQLLPDGRQPALGQPHRLPHPGAVPHLCRQGLR
jgi:hypothetical protein